MHRSFTSRDIFPANGEDVPFIYLFLFSKIALFIFICVVFNPFPSACADVPCTYIFINKAPGLDWKEDHPETITRAGFDEIAEAIQVPPNDHMRLGVSFVWSLFRNKSSVMIDGINRFISSCEETGMPILINLDGQNWWEDRPDLWNWWDPKAPGYDPENVYNVEWTGWEPSTAVKIGWRNWGSQIRVAPQPNLASPRVMEAHLKRLREIVPVIAAWYHRLPPERKYLFGGLKLGHEASIGVNAFYYPNGNLYLEEHPNDPSRDPAYGFNAQAGWDGGLARLGYAAVKAAGLKSSGEITAEDIGKVIHRYLESMCRVAAENGLPPEVVYTHQGGTFAPWDKNLPFWPAVNPYATPGWSFYGADPHDATGLPETLGRSVKRWAAVEWWWGAPDAAGWEDHLLRTLNFGDCCFIAIYNWNCGYKLKEDSNAWRALRKVISEWPVKR